MKDETAYIPLVPARIYGVRHFTVAHYGALKAVTQDFDWLPGLNTASCCYGCERPGGLLCTCGFYAFHGIIPNSYESPLRIAAVIAGEGRATVGELGFRVEKARIVALVHPLMETSKRTRIKLIAYNLLAVLALVGTLIIACGVWLTSSENTVTLALMTFLVALGVAVRGKRRLLALQYVFLFHRRIKLIHSIYKDVAWHSSLEEAIKGLPLQGIPENYKVPKTPYRQKEVQL